MFAPMTALEPGAVGPRRIDRPVGVLARRERLQFGIVTGGVRVGGGLPAGQNRVRSALDRGWSPRAAARTPAPGRPAPGFRNGGRPIARDVRPRGARRDRDAAMRRGSAARRRRGARPARGRKQHRARRRLRNRGDAPDDRAGCRRRASLGTTSIAARGPPNPRPSPRECGLPVAHASRLRDRAAGARLRHPLCAAL